MSIQPKVTARGFTIIEVVLVLAIAGLIFLMVFIALPSLQRSQRDTQRRADVNRFISQLQQYSVNNRGRIPTDDEAVKSFAQDYLKWNATDVNASEFNDPKTGEPYTIIVEQHTDALAEDKYGIVYYANKSACDGEKMKGSANAREAAVLMRLEGSGSFCQSNK